MTTARRAFTVMINTTQELADQAAAAMRDPALDPQARARSEGKYIALQARATTMRKTLAEGFDDPDPLGELEKASVAVKRSAELTDRAQRLMKTCLELAALDHETIQALQTVLPLMPPEQAQPFALMIGFMMQTAALLIGAVGATTPGDDANVEEALAVVRQTHTTVRELAVLGRSGGAPVQ